VAARQLAVDALVRIDAEGAYANLILPTLLSRSSLDQRDRAFVTELVYGTTRMCRSCDWLVDRFLPDPERIDATARAWLRIGAFQLAFLATPAHAAVGATVEAAPRRLSGLCNAVLRKVATSLPVTWPSDAVRLSQPDWIIELLSEDLGSETALAALEAMNASATSSVREDGYVQDLGSQWIVEAVGVDIGDLVLDMCAAPGGKATALAAAGARVVASDVRRGRVGLVVENAHRLQLSADSFMVLVADGTSLPIRPGIFDKVLLDAPCSGLGALRRRPDARWRIMPGDIDALGALQRRLIESAITMLRPGGELIFSVCTLSRAESLDIDMWIGEQFPEMEALPAPGGVWTPLGRGALLLPQSADTDGMYILRLRVPEPSDAPNSLP
jgi:16S rRNA (cytosine967-C5)-methyltransferase